MTSEGFISYWNGLPHTKRKAIVDKSYSILKKRADQQLQQIKDFEKTSSTIVHLFGITTIRTFWENCDFLFSLGKNKWKTKSHFIIRPTMEITGKLAYFNQQTKEKQKELARVELLNALKKEHDYEMKKDRNGINQKFLDKVKDTYNKFKITNDPEITESRKKFSRFLGIYGFPSDMSKCFTESKIPEPDLLYTFFDRNSSLLHGNFFTSLTHALPSGSDLMNYLHDAQNGLFCASTVLKITDLLLIGKVHTDTVLTINAFESLHRGGH